MEKPFQWWQCCVWCKVHLLLFWEVPQRSTFLPHPPTPSLSFSLLPNPLLLPTYFLSHPHPPNSSLCPPLPLFLYHPSLPSPLSEQCLLELKELIDHLPVEPGLHYYWALLFVWSCWPCCTRRRRHSSTATSCTWPSPWWGLWTLGGRAPSSPTRLPLRTCSVILRWASGLSDCAVTAFYLWSRLKGTGLNKHILAN